MSRPVWILQQVAAEGPGLIADVLRERGRAMRTLSIHEGEAVPRSAEGAAGIVVMGGPMGVYEAERYPHLADELALLGDALARGIPVLGVCLGSQLLASALGARVYPSGFKEIGWGPVTRTDAAAEDPLWRGLSAGFMGFHWHGDVFDLPAGAVALASSPRTRVQSFRAGKSAYGVLFHLEVTAEQVDGMVTAFGDELRATGLSGEEILAGRARHLADLQEQGRRLFGAWSDLPG